MARGKVFRQIGGARVKRSVWDLSYDHKTTCDIGDLIPIMHKEVIPGDYFTVGNELAIRLQPMLAPVFHELNAYVHYFFVPHRLLWKNWENFITKGKDGEFESFPPSYQFSGALEDGDIFNKPALVQRGSLWDYLGYPILPSFDTISGSNRPRCFRQRAYNLIWYEYYRDQNLTTEGVDYNLLNNDPNTSDADKPVEDVPKGSFIRTRCWEKDYFTSSLPRQQRGAPVAMPIRGESKAFFKYDDIGKEWISAVPGSANSDYGNISGMHVPVPGQDGNQFMVVSVPTGSNMTEKNINIRSNLQRALNKNTVDLSTAVSFDVNEMRFAFQVQKWLERNMRAGARYKEHLIAHYGVSPRDDRLNRPEYLGGTKQPIIISEVLQTSSADTTSPQANMAGHGISVNSRKAFSYHVKEHGTIMGILSVIPRTAYSQGFERTEMNKTVYDYFFPEFQHLGEQGVKTWELYVGADNASMPDEIFGFQGRYNEYRYSPSKITGEFRDLLDYWHFGRKFSQKPVLNNNFVLVEPNKQPFAVRNYNSLLVQCGNLIRAVRPMTISPDPGLIDHS